LTDPQPYLDRFKEVEPQMTEFIKAHAIYIERQEEHGDLVWQASGWNGMLVDMRKKMDRLWYKFWNKPRPHDVEKALDSAYDLLNFTVFFIRQVEANNPDGDWPWGS
jgi:hypothetical protein